MGATAHYNPATGKMEYYGGSVPIDDTDTSEEKTWSSEKIQQEIDATQTVKKSSNNGVNFRKYGNVVTLLFTGGITWGETSGSGDSTITYLSSSVLPLQSGDRPPDHVYFEVGDGGVSDKRYLGIIRWDDGRVGVWKRGQTIATIYGTATFITG